MGTYDSPTFLGNKDKLLLGMTIGQVGVFVGSGVLWLMLALSANMGTLSSLLVFAPMHGVTVAFFLVKLSGMSVPAYLLATLKSMVSTTVYHVDGAVARHGMPEWFEAQETAAPETADALVRIQEEGGKASRHWVGSLMFFRRKPAVAVARAQAKRQEAGALAGIEAEHRANEAARGMQRSLLSMFRIALKGHG